MTPTPRKRPGAEGNRNVGRGRAWEDAVRVMFDRVDGLKLTKTSAPFRVLGSKKPGVGWSRFEGVFERNGQCDFVGWYHGLHVEIEAKRFTASTGRWPFKAAIAAHQIERMRNADADGCLAGVVLMADEGAYLFGITWRTIDRLIADGRASVDVMVLLAWALQVGSGSGVFDLRSAGGMEAFVAYLANERIRR